ncbi:MAG TPA: type II toxin-antitoxin system RelE/ParE family toxin [Nanoarchaeota archaeon]|nr:type II toxin-antitoxin system RelE/ParE family toxin [Nanoarchaeota archaeon]
MFNIEYSPRAKIFLEKLDKYIAKRVLERIERLKENPVPSDAKFMGRDSGEKVFRYRIGGYRALYTFDEAKGILLITKIDKRSKVYDE